MPNSNPFEVYYLDVLKFKYAKFFGRARRSELWYFALFNFIVSLGLGMVDAFTGLGFLSSVYGLAVLVPSLAVGVRRLHDTGKSGWWILVGLVPLIGWIVLIVFYLQDSQPFDNQYGPNPKADSVIV